MPGSSKHIYILYIYVLSMFFYNGRVLSLVAGSEMEEEAVESQRISQSSHILRSSCCSYVTTVQAHPREVVQ